MYDLWNLMISTDLGNIMFFTPPGLKLLTTNQIDFQLQTTIFLLNYGSFKDKTFIFGNPYKVYNNSLFNTMKKGIELTQSMRHSKTVLFHSFSQEFINDLWLIKLATIILYQ